MSGRAFSLPIPVGFESLNPVADLTDRIGREGPLFAIRLWQHRQRSGSIIRGENAAGTLERHAMWTRKRGALAAALVASGIVEQTPTGLRIVDPFELGSVEWMGGRFSDDDVEAEVSGLAPDDRAKKYEAGRKRIKRNKALTDEERETAFEDLRRQFGVGHPDMSAGQPDTNRTCPPDTTGHEPDTDRTPTGHEPPPQDKERARTPVTGPAPSPLPAGSAKDLADAPPPDLFESGSSPAKPARPPRKPAATGVGGDCTAWLETFRRLTAQPGETLEQVEARAPDDGPLRTRYATARKKPGRDAATLLTALERGLSGAWWGAITPMSLLCESAITAGLAPPGNSRARPAPYDPKTTTYGPNDPEMLREFGLPPEGP